jgi:cell division protease FtsH
MGIEDRLHERAPELARPAEEKIMADNDWLEELDETELIIEGRLTNARMDKSAQYLLPRALLESVVGMEGIKRLHDDKRLCAVIEVPAADWANPTMALLKAWNWDFHHMRTVPLRPSQLADDTSSQQTIHALSAGGRVLGISQDPVRLLPASMRTGADMNISLPPPTGRIIAAVIKAMTGRNPRGLPDHLPIPLGFDEICACLRPKQSASRCVARLLKAIADRSQADPLTQDVPHVRDLHGYGAARSWALDLVEDIDAWRRGDIAFHEIDAAVVLASAPGLGKTSFVRSLARSAGLPLIATSVSQWFANSPGYLDSVIKQIDAVFEQARVMAPAVVFLDEIDAVPNRATISPRGADWWLPVITHLLTRLDGAASDSVDRLVIIAATNHPERLDEALVRPGRLNRIIHIGPPDAEAMRGILRQHLGADLVDADLTLAAGMAAGATGAMAVQWIKSARRAARTAGRPMALSDLLAAIAPQDGRSRETLESTAIHEASHAVIAHVLGLGKIEAISIVRRGHSGGSTVLALDGSVPTRGAVENLVVQLLAGRAAEEAFFGEPGTGSGGDAKSDLARSTRLVGMLHISEGFAGSLLYRGDADAVPGVLARHPDIASAVEAHLHRLYSYALNMVLANRPHIRLVADALLAERQLGSARFLDLMASAEAMAIEGRNRKEENQS